MSKGQPIEWIISPNLWFSGLISHNSFNPIPYVWGSEFSLKLYLLIKLSNDKDVTNISINKKEILKYINSGGIPIITGFQGISNNRRITTLGRGGSDATAISIAKFFGATDCFIYTDVSGVFTTDPKLNPKAKKINKISYEEMLEMSSMGAKILQTRSVELAMKNNLSLQVLSSITNLSGTMIVNEKDLVNVELDILGKYIKNFIK